MNWPHPQDKTFSFLRILRRRDHPKNAKSSVYTCLQIPKTTFGVGICCVEGMPANMGVIGTPLGQIGFNGSGSTAMGGLPISTSYYQYVLHTYVHY